MSDALTVETAAAFLRERGWRVDPPLPPPSPRQLHSFERDEYQIAAMARGWRGGSVAKDFLPTDVQRECQERAAARFDRQRSASPNDSAPPSATR